MTISAQRGKSKAIRVVSTAIVSLALSTAINVAAEWQIDPSHANLDFSVKHLGLFNVTGRMGAVRGTVRYSADDPASATVNVEIDAASVDTGNAERDQHLRSADFFDTDKYPLVTFTSKRVRTAGTGKLKLIGDLTIHGVTKEVALDVEGPTSEVKGMMGKTRIGATARVTIDRRDFGLTWSRRLDTGGLVVGNDVAISIALEMVKTP